MPVPYQSVLQRIWNVYSFVILGEYEVPLSDGQLYVPIPDVAVGLADVVVPVGVKLDKLEKEDEDVEVLVEVLVLAGRVAEVDEACLFGFH
jgi:hypothetical protein